MQFYTVSSWEFLEESLRVILVGRPGSLNLPQVTSWHENVRGVDRIRGPVEAQSFFGFLCFSLCAWRRQRLWTRDHRRSRPAEGRGRPPELAAVTEKGGGHVFGSACLIRSEEKAGGEGQKRCFCQT